MYNNEHQPLISIQSSQHGLEFFLFFFNTSLPHYLKRQQIEKEKEEEYYYYYYYYSSTILEKEEESLKCLGNFSHDNSTFSSKRSSAYNNLCDSISVIHASDHQAAVTSHRLSYQFPSGSAAITVDKLAF